MTYDNAPAEERMPYVFSALRPLVPSCLYGMNAADERRTWDRHCRHENVVGINWRDPLH